MSAPYVKRTSGLKIQNKFLEEKLKNKGKGIKDGGKYEELLKMNETIQQNLEEELTNAIYPYRILATTTAYEGGKKVLKWLVQWKDQSVEEATWEDAITIQHQFPDFHPNSLEHKALVQEGGIDGLIQPILKVYTRRNKRNIEG